MKKGMFVISIVSLALLSLFGIGYANSRSNPAYINEPVTIRAEGKVVELELLETYLTDSPDGLSKFSHIPSEHEILMARFRVKVIQSEDESVSRLYHMFQAVNGEGFPVDNNVVVTPAESLAIEFYGTKEIYGWVSVIVQKGDPNPLIVYRRGSPGEAWFSPVERKHIILAGLSWGDTIDKLGPVRFISDDGNWVRYEKVDETLTEIGHVEVTGVRYLFVDDKLAGINVLIEEEDAAFLSFVFSALYGPWHMTDSGLSWESEKYNTYVQIRTDETYGTFVGFLDYKVALDKFGK